MSQKEYRKERTKWRFEYNGVLCERLSDGSLKCGLCPCVFFTLRDLEYHLKNHKSKTQQHNNGGGS